MSPEKLFDYLEGKFSDDERAAFEEQLATNPQLQRELAIAREMHRRARGSREVVGDQDPDIPLPAKGLGRKVITAFAGYLVILRGKTFTVGDRITMGGVRGDVISLGFLQTRIMEMGERPAIQTSDSPSWVPAPPSRPT